MVVVLQLVLAIVAYAMVRLGSQRDKADLIESDDLPKPAPVQQQIG